MHKALHQRDNIQTLCVKKRRIKRTDQRKCHDLKTQIIYKKEPKKKKEDKLQQPTKAIPIELTER